MWWECRGLKVIYIESYIIFPIFYKLDCKEKKNGKRGARVAGTIGRAVSERGQKLVTLRKEKTEKAFKIVWKKKRPRCCAAS